MPWNLGYELALTFFSHKVTVFFRVVVFCWCANILKQPTSLFCACGLHLQSVISMHWKAVRMWWTMSGSFPLRSLTTHIDDQVIIWPVPCYFIKVPFSSLAVKCLLYLININWSSLVIFFFYLLSICSYFEKVLYLWVFLSINCSSKFINCVRH